jgi:NTE family protein
VRTPFDALALAAGGARGAFQAGALLCLAEQGVRFRSIAGTSVGALNGAFLAQGDGSPGHLEDLCRLWRRLPELVVPEVGARALRGVAMLAAMPAGARIPALLAKLFTGRTALLDPAPLAALLDRCLDYDRIRTGPTDLVIALLREVAPVYDILTGPWRIASYVEARRLKAAQLRAALLAAAAIPLVFPSQRVLADRHADAGLAVPLPTGALYQRGARAIVSVFLSDLTPQNPDDVRADYPGTALLEIRPSVSLGPGLLSCFDFSRTTIESLIERGYRDAGAVLANVAELAGALIELRSRGRRNHALARALPRRPVR